MLGIAVQALAVENVGTGDADAQFLELLDKLQESIRCGEAGAQKFLAQIRREPTPEFEPAELEEEPREIPASWTPDLIAY